jgi:hypothetical protein
MVGFQFSTIVVVLYKSTAIQYPVGTIHNDGQDPVEPVNACFNCASAQVLYTISMEHFNNYVYFAFPVSSYSTITIALTIQPNPSHPHSQTAAPPQH